MKEKTTELVIMGDGDYWVKGKKQYVLCFIRETYNPIKPPFGMLVKNELQIFEDYLTAKNVRYSRHGFSYILHV